GAVRICDASRLRSACIEEVPLTDAASMTHSSWVTSLLYTADGKTLISGSSDNTVKFWNTTNGKQIGAPLEGQETQIWGLAFYPPHGEASLVTLGDDGSVAIWDIASRSPLGPPLRTGLPSESFAMSPDGNYVFLGSFDTRTERWKLPDPSWQTASCAIAG